jgi:protein tyrosine/serine phosphatase
VLTYGAPAARAILLYVASLNPDSPSAFYIHCTTGNNRSGVFIGVILSLLGVKPERIAEEYSLSDIGLIPSREAAVARLMKSPVFAGDDDGGRARATRMVGARPESMLAMLEMVNKKWGSAEGYVKTMAGLTDEEVEKIRRVLTVTEGVTSRKRAGSAWDTTKAFATKLWDSFS